MQSPSPSFRVALADDDPQVRQSARRILEELGADVEEAIDGAGLRDLVAQPGRVDLVVTDVAMPGATGLAVLAELRARGDTTPAVVVTGDIDTATSPALELGHVVAVAKPFTSAALKRAIGFAMGGHRPVASAGARH
jgi:CheY-like chemotaxis protein